ncbi:hypothetical protein LH427_09555 [Laribacter hongkongensis]|uniref:hypothetical protein n=1 Tax=Laribacter hongkongensis TaxID=168471 RepID=UPI001EFDA52E|nr:hypothetical protein [Laribacter hongkongensis]MCG8993217.1 hypothetical protein [Laribacter hongkongensis]MCG8997964.1 hypothetical protein [Laribacter hongkongensis]MCG9002325.1 hypothetical protein [Laribacter hongkongensis]MCG9005635.1 hypothetical protein [Laribacter hongkongensis]MCG9008772.1 hypothetical protein [Laribacter hongkongensis]
MPEAHAIAAHRASRARLLDALYDARLKAAKQRGADYLEQRELEQLCGGALDFDLPYLVERGLVCRDGFRLRLTAAGIDEVETRHAR